MTLSLALLLITLTAIISGVAGLICGYRLGRTVGGNDTIRKLVAAKDGSCWEAAHYLEADAAANAVTEKLAKRKVT